MRSLTPDESTLLKQRRAGMAQLLEERMPVLAHFAEVLELAEPTLIVADPDRYLPSVSEFMRNQEVTPEDETWIMVRLAYLIGEVLIQRLSGCWILNEWPESPYFTKYVVGRFASVRNINANVDPFAVAQAFIATPPGRDLAQWVDDLEQGLRGE